ncbi:MAG: hypothetical protein QM528_06205 [Phycisphaerales bacterium]|nr:hypothetical protein [Phycisphaerales bacterium]
MKLHEIITESNDLPPETKVGILKFIEHKTDMDMDKVNVGFEKMDAKFDKVFTEIKSLEKDTNNLKWFMGIGFTFMTIILAIVALKH